MAAKHAIIVITIMVTVIYSGAYPPMSEEGVSLSTKQTPEILDEKVDTTANVATHDLGATKQEPLPAGLGGKPEQPNIPSTLIKRDVKESNATGSEEDDSKSSEEQLKQDNPVMTTGRRRRSEEQSWEQQATSAEQWGGEEADSDEGSDDITTVEESSSEEGSPESHEKEE